MKRGNVLIALLVLLTAFSIFSTGLYSSFMDTFTGNSFSYITGNIVSVTGAAMVDNPRTKGEHCTSNSDCKSDSTPRISNACRGTNKYCYDQLPFANEQSKRGLGRVCNSNSQCKSNKCSNGICGKKRGETCAIGECLSGDCFAGVCDYSNVNTGNNVNDLCSIDTDCKKNEGYRCSNFHRCTKITSLRMHDLSCTYDENCLSGNCNANGRCANSAGGELCNLHTDCTDGYFCESYNKRCTAKASIGTMCSDSSQCPGSNTNPNRNACYKKIVNGVPAQFGICGLKEGQTCANELVCLSKTCTNGKCAKSDTNEFCLQDSDCNSGDCGNSLKCVAGVAPALKSNGAECTANNDCLSNVCSTIGDKKYCGFPTGYSCQASAQCASSNCANINPVTHFGACAEAAVNPQVNANDGMNRLKTAIENALNLLKVRLNGIEAKHQNQAAGAAVEGFPDGGQIANNAPQTLAEWKLALTTLSNSMQGVEDRICAESFRHPEIENDGLPCTQQLAGQFAQAPVAPEAAPRLTLFQRLGLFNPRIQIPFGAGP